MTVWALAAWLCAGPGITGECRPLPPIVYPNRHACLVVQRRAMAQAPTMWGRCHRIPEPHPDAEPR